MKVAACLLLFCLVSFVSSIKFKANVNISINANTDGSWRYRDTNLVAKGIPGFDAVFYNSKSVNRDKQQHSWNVSGLVGAAVFVLTQVPFSFVAPYEIDKAYNGNGFGVGFQKFDADAALAYIATAYLRLEERAPNGSVVATQSLRYDRDFTYSLDAQYSDGVLSAASIVGTPSSGSWTYNTTFIASSVLGVLDLANAVVGPSTFEQVVQINNYPYQAKENHLTLVMLTATGSASASSDSYITSVVSGSGAAKVYFAASAKAQVDGRTANVNVATSVSTSVDADLATDTYFVSQVLTKYSAVSYTKVSVDFPAGAASIAYDPSVGSGQPVSSESSSSSSATTVVVSCFALFVLLASLLL